MRQLPHKIQLTLTLLLVCLYSLFGQRQDRENRLVLQLGLDIAATHASLSNMDELASSIFKDVYDLVEFDDYLPNNSVNFRLKYFVDNKYLVIGYKNHSFGKRSPFTDLSESIGNPGTDKYLIQLVANIESYQFSLGGGIVYNVQRRLRNSFSISLNYEIQAGVLINFRFKDVETGEVERSGSFERLEYSDYFRLALYRNNSRFGSAIRLENYYKLTRHLSIHGDVYFEYLTDVLINAIENNTLARGGSMNLGISLGMSLGF